MTDDEAKALGLRAVAAGWQWEPGDHLGPRGDLEVISATEAPGLLVLTRPPQRLWQMPPEMVEGVGPYAPNGPQWPDLRRQAAWGRLLDMVCDAWCDPRAYAVNASITGPPDRPWVVVLPSVGADSRPGDFAATRIEAAVQALEAAKAARGTA